jgi:hypothetical protein
MSYFTKVFATSEFPLSDLSIIMYGVAGVLFGFVITFATIYWIIYLERTGRI